MAKLTYPDGNVIDYTYTARNQLWQVQNGGPPPVATYAYDLAGRLTNLDVENGVNTVLTHGTAAGELTAVDHAKGANYVDGVLYSLNANNGRREGITRSGGWNDAYGYDAAGQVTGASYAANTTGMGSEGFTYDAAGNRTSSVNNGTNVTEYAPNVLDQYSAIGGVSQAHDANGNLTTFVPPVSGALPITMKWDGENRLTEITKTGHKVTNVYDALHRRILKKIHDDDTEVIAKTIAFVYDGWNVIQETEYAGSTTTVVDQKRYTWGADVSGSLQGAGGVGGLLMAEETVISGTTQTTPIPHYYHYDGNGNVIAITDATGTPEGRYRYTAFGGAANTVTNTTFAATQPYRFSTKYLDKEVETAEGTYFYGFRHYVPVIGRWPSRDPIGERGGVNLYGMVGNRCLNSVDYLGLEQTKIRVFLGESDTIVREGFVFHYFDTETCWCWYVSKRLETPVYKIRFDIVEWTPAPRSGGQRYGDAIVEGGKFILKQVPILGEIGDAMDAAPASKDDGPIPTDATIVARYEGTTTHEVLGKEKVIGVSYSKPLRKAKSASECPKYFEHKYRLSDKAPKAKVVE